MTKVIVLGHGGYGTAVQRNMRMLVGDCADFLFVDFNEKDDLNTLKDKISDALKAVGDSDVLFACDLTGGSPFRESAMICAQHPNYAVVAGLNTSAYTEMTFNLEMTPMQLAELGADVAKQAIMIFPPK